MNKTFSFSLSEKGLCKDSCLQGALYFCFHSLWVELLEERTGPLPWNSSTKPLRIIAPWSLRASRDSAVISGGKWYKGKKYRSYTMKN